MAKKDETTNEGNGWKGKKITVTLIIVLTGIALATVMCIVERYELAVAAFGIAAGAVGIYNGSNAYLGGRYSNHGLPPGMEP